MSRREEDQKVLHLVQREIMTGKRPFLFLLYLLIACCLFSQSVKFHYKMDLSSSTYANIEFRDNYDDSVPITVYELDLDSADRGLYMFITTNMRNLDVKMTFSKFEPKTQGNTVSIPYSVSVRAVIGSFVAGNASINDINSSAEIQYSIIDSQTESGLSQTYSALIEYAFGDNVDPDKLPADNYSSTIRVEVTPKNE